MITRVNGVNECNIRLWLPSEYVNGQSVPSCCRKYRDQTGSQWTIRPWTEKHEWWPLRSWHSPEFQWRSPTFNRIEVRVPSACKQSGTCAQQYRSINGKSSTAVKIANVAKNVKTCKDFKGPKNRKIHWEEAPRPPKSKETTGTGGFNPNFSTALSKDLWRKKKPLFRPLFPKVSEKSSGEKSGLKTPNFCYGFL